MFKRYVYFNLLVVSFFSFAFKEDKTMEHPNLLIVLVDQWRGQALGFLKEEPVLTPHLDRFAGSARTFRQAVCNYALCSPSRASLMTGQYPMRNGVYGNVNSTNYEYHVELAQDALCWSDLTKKAGYDNGYIGKWHLDLPHKPYIPTSNNKGRVAWNEWTPPERRHGFDYWYAYGTYDEHMKPMYWDTDASRDDFHYVNQWGPEHEADKAIAFLNKHKQAKRPFALVVSMNPPHSVYKQVPAKYLALYQNTPLEELLAAPDIPEVGTPMGDAYRRDIRQYYAAISGVDEQFGRIMDALEADELDDNTVVVFLADHGNCLGRHNEISKNTFYEESVRIPFMIYWKGHIQAGIDRTQLLSMVDVYPTLLDLLGIDYQNASIAGHSFADILLDEKPDNLVVKQQFLIGNVKGSDRASGFRGIRTARYKLVYERKDNKLNKYFFDLLSDPFELKNLYAPDKPEVTDLHEDLKNWLLQTNDPFIADE